MNRVLRVSGRALAVLAVAYMANFGYHTARAETKEARRKAIEAEVIALEKQLSSYHSHSRMSGFVPGTSERTPLSYERDKVVSDWLSAYQREYSLKEQIDAHKRKAVHVF